MMVNLKKLDRLPVSQLDSHIYIADLLYLDGPLVSLFRDEKRNWLYLWCDTDSESKERWLIFPVLRQGLVKYLKKESTLLDIVKAAPSHWALDYSVKVIEDEEKKDSTSRSVHRSLKNIKDLALIESYLPSTDSYFDDELAPSIAASRELDPTSFDIPIDGDWFIADLERFNKVYAQLYAFFYCSKPQFISDIGRKVRRYLLSPWEGGYSRVNLFEALKRYIPSVHDLEIKRLNYSSPGEIRVEALASVGETVSKTVLLFLKNQEVILDLTKKINLVLSTSNLRKRNVSLLSDESLPLTGNQKVYLKQMQTQIAVILEITNEMEDLTSYAPNLVVSGKVATALVSRIQRLAEFQESGLLDLTRNKTAIGKQ